MNLDKLTPMLQKERELFVSRTPKSAQIAAGANQHMFFGVPLHWMSDWGTPHPLHVDEAQGVHLRDVDGNQLIDFCLGDTGAMFGHSPAPVVNAVTARLSKGWTTMLPGEDAAIVARLLSERFGMSHWQFALSATDANRFLLRWVRAATGRNKLLVFNGCYHGTVDDVFVDLENGQPVQRRSLLGQVYDLTQGTVVVEFNDLKALEEALSAGDVAAVLAEPVMTNVGMVLPDPDFWSAAVPIIQKHGTMLIMDETHTISSGPGGYAQAHGIEADAVVVGKPLGGGIPCAAYGMSPRLAELAMAAKNNAPPGHSGIGTTLSGNLLAMTAIRATLENLMTADNYARMIAQCGKLSQALRGSIERHGLPWVVTQVGARCEFQFCATAPRNGTEAEAAMIPQLERYIHLYLLNRGLMITPFHNMLLVSPETTDDHCQKLASTFDELCQQLATQV